MYCFLERFTCLPSSRTYRRRTLANFSWLVVSPGAAQEPTTATTGAEDQLHAWGLGDGRVIGLREDALPDESAWQSLWDFFRQHQPLSQQVGSVSRT